jgi:large subunit ribosomal protein L13
VFIGFYPPWAGARGAGLARRKFVKTYSMKRDEIAKDWLVVDAEDVPLGRLATQVATFLRGKHKPTFTPNLDMGDNVIVLNAAKVKLTGQKREQKVYLSHTGYMGGQRVTTMAKLMAKHPEEVVLRAVKGMLPKTRLGRKQLTNLRVYADAEHPHGPQQPQTVEL